jgi:hypothetical protein
MKKKSGIFLILAALVFFSLTLGLISSANDTNSSTINITGTVNTTIYNSGASSQNLTGFDKSYDCLKTQIESKGYSSLNVEELAWSLMALGYDSSFQSKLKTEIEAKSQNSECWPKGACTIKETSLVLLAYNHIGTDTKKIEAWLLNHTSIPSDLVWYLEIDTNEKSTCNIVYDNSTTRKVTINDDKTISGAGGCFRSAYNGYWLEVDSSCYSKQFEISCDKDFVTTLVYKKRSGSTYYVSTFTNAANVGGKTLERVESLCFKQGSNCDFESSLWASLALQKKGYSNKAYLPYLMAMNSQEYNRIMPFAFLYAITGFNEYYTDLVNQQNKLGYWQLSDTTRRYYDTGIALFSLSGKSTDAGQKAIDYLLDPKTLQTGCFQNSIRDTAIISFSAAFKSASRAAVKKCSEFSSYSCTSTTKCLDNLEGQVLEFECSGSYVCCSKKEDLKTCSQFGGKKCSIDEECTGEIEDSASDTSACCLNGECKLKQEPITTQCQDNGFDCQTECNKKTQEVKSYSCDTIGVTCCGPKPISTPWYARLWIWLLIILIILVILAIIFRNQVQIWYFKVKNKFSKKPVEEQKRNNFGFQNPQPNQTNFGPRRIIPGAPPRPFPSGPRPGIRPFPRDKELDETLKKLRDMGK